MVDIAEIAEEQEQEQQEVPQSQERLLDAQEIEAVAKTVQRVSVRFHLEALAKKLRKESDALRRMEQSQKQDSSTKEELKGTEKPSASSENATTAAPTPAPPAAVPAPPAAAPPVSTGGGKLLFTPIDRFSFDFGGYNSAFVTLYVPLPSVGTIPREQVTCQFTKDSFDLVVRDLKGKSYRLFRDHLEKDINAEKSKYIIKADKIVIKLAKNKTGSGDYGTYDFWSKLTADPKKKKTEKENPQASIMEMMKDMYRDGDDQMKKVIGETFMKQQRGELGKGGGLGDMNLDDDF